MKRNLLFLVVVMILSPFAAYAGITGTLSGKVLDEKGKPVAGASIRIKGTNRGGNAKINGSFVITNIPSGSFEVLIKALNYKDYTANVRISADQTTELNAKMVESAIQAKVTVIEAEKEKLVDKGKVGTIRASSGEENIKIARETVQQVVALKAGVQADAGGFQIRGSRATESQIRVDGLDVGDQFAGGTGNAGFAYSPTVSSRAVEEVQVMTGAFSAEYGNALGGVVNTVVRTGRTDSYDGFIFTRTDAPGLFGKSSNGYKLMGKNENSYEFGVGGPIPMVDGITFYVTGRYAHEEFGTNRLGVIDPLGNNLGQIPFSETWVKNLTGRLKFSFNNININVGGQMGIVARERGSWGWMYAEENSVTNLRTENGRTFGDTTFIPAAAAKPAVVNQYVNNLFVLINHTISDNSFYELKISTNINNQDVSKRSDFNDPGLFGGIDVFTPADNLTQAQYDPTNPLRMAAGKDQAIDVFESAPAPGGLRTQDGYALVNGFLRNQITGYTEGPADAISSRNAYGLSGYFNQYGNERNFDFRRSQFLQLDGNFNTVITAGETQHNIKAGFEFRTFTVGRHYNSLPWDPNGFYDIYTEDFGGNIYASTENIQKLTGQSKKPFSGSVYVQDQLRYKGIILNPGLRFDFTDPNSFYRLPSSNDKFRPISQQSDSGFAQATLKYQVSPRLNIVYPITDRSVLNLAYGIYFQMPVLNDLFDAFNTELPRGNAQLSNPNLEAQRTNQYQIAYNLQLTDDFAFDVTAYYKDIYNQTGVRFVPSVPQSYYETVVAEYGNSRGIEVSFKKRPTASDNIGLNINYTLSSTTGTSSSTSSNYNAPPDPFNNNVPSTPLNEYASDRDRRHQLNAIIDFVWMRDQGPSIGGIKPLENSNLNLLTRFQSGLPYTRLTAKGDPIGEFNAERQPSWSQTDLRFSKSFPLKDWFGEGAGKTMLEFNIDVLNLFNQIAVTGYYARTGDPDQDNDGLNRQVGDFSSITFYKEAQPGNTASFQNSQYDQSGYRLYSPQADFNNDGKVTQVEKYQAYQNYVRDFQARRQNNYQAPRQVFFGFTFRF